LRIRRGIPDDALLIPYISSAINPHGAHGESASVMQQIIQKAISKLTFGAHLGWMIS
jgi:lactam utilization protein B